MNRQLISIQYLRAVAAAMVVLHHARNSADWLFNPLQQYGGLAFGVDIFFVISGFIMYTAAKNEAAGTFLWRRFTRVAPLYWVATLVALALTLVVKGRALDAELLDHAARSILFVPHESPLKPGNVWPLLVPGWSLNYEMFFYVVFGAAIAFGRPLAITTGALMILVGTGAVLNPSSPAAATYTSAMLVQFVAGIWLGWWHERRGFQRLGILIPLGACVLLLAPTNEVGRAVAASAIVAGCLSCENNLPRLSWLKALGDASYSLYLFHVFVLAAAAMVFSRLHFLHGWTQFVVWMFSTLTLSLGAALFAHHYIEKPLLRRLSVRRLRPAVAA